MKAAGGECYRQFSNIPLRCGLEMLDSVLLPVCLLALICGVVAEDQKVSESEAGSSVNYVRLDTNAAPELFSVIEEVKPEELEELLGIISDSSLTMEEAEEKIEEWVSRQPKDIQRAINSAKEKASEVLSKFDEEIEGADLSEEAKAALMQIKEATNNKDQTIVQLADAIKEILESQDENVRNELHNMHISINMHAFSYTIYL